MGSTPLWRLLNQSREVDTRILRLGSMVFLAVYGAIALARPVGEHPEFLLIRLAVCLLAGAGIVLAERMTWRAVRAYLLGLALLLSLGTSYIDGTLGHGLRELPLSALAIFVPLVFLQTGRDLIVAIVGLLIGHAILFTVVLPPPLIPASTVYLVLVGAAAQGAMAGMTLLAFRARLQESMGHVERALRAKNEFLNTMSHELRSPLHVVIGYADMLREGDAESPATLGEHIRASALELLQLVENTMNVARLEAGKATLRLDEFSPAEMFEALAEDVRALPEAKSGVPVKWRVSRELPAVQLDRLKLKEIVQNLISNALKFTDEGAVLVTVDRQAGHLRIAVRDTGRGIPLDAHERIFELFERVEDTGGNHPAGAGLGLYIVKSLVDLMGGEIAVASEPGEGSCFTVRLPLRPAAAQRVAAAPGPRARGGGKGHRVRRPARASDTRAAARPRERAG
jgi:signal transduction histidine kinase